VSLTKITKYYKDIYNKWHGGFNPQFFASVPSISYFRALLFNDVANCEKLSISPPNRKRRGRIAKTQNTKSISSLLFPFFLKKKEKVEKVISNYVVIFFNKGLESVPPRCPAPQPITGNLWRQRVSTLWLESLALAGRSVSVRSRSVRLCLRRIADLASQPQHSLVLVLPVFWFPRKAKASWLAILKFCCLRFENQAFGLKIYQNECQTTWNPKTLLWSLERGKLFVAVEVMLICELCAVFKTCPVEFRGRFPIVPKVTLNHQVRPVT